MSAKLPGKHITQAISLNGDSPSYKILESHGLLTTKYRIKSENDLVLELPNSTRLKNSIISLASCFCCLCGFSKSFEVPDGSVRKGYDGRGKYTFFGPGKFSPKDIGMKYMKCSGKITQTIFVLCLFYKLGVHNVFDRKFSIDHTNFIYEFEFY